MFAQYDMVSPTPEQQAQIETLVSSPTSVGQNIGTGLIEYYYPTTTGLSRNMVIGLLVASALAWIFFIKNKRR